MSFPCDKLKVILLVKWRNVFISLLFINMWLCIGKTTKQHDSPNNSYLKYQPCCILPCKSTHGAGNWKTVISLDLPVFHWHCIWNTAPHWTVASLDKASICVPTETEEIHVQVSTALLLLDILVNPRLPRTRQCEAGQVLSHARRFVLSKR